MRDFESQIRAFAAQIETELETGHLNFPTAMEISLRIKQLADNPESSIDDIAALVHTEPVLSAKVVRMANAILLNPYGVRVTSVNNAVKRIGLAALRCLAFAVSAEQISQDRRSEQLRKIAVELWHHCADVASWSYAFANHLHTVNPDTAMLTGMMVDIGQFFLLARVADYPVLEDDIERFSEFVSVWTEPITRSVLDAFDLPDDIVDALNNDGILDGTWPPSTLHDIVWVALLATDVPNSFDSLRKNTDKTGHDNDMGIDRLQLATLLDETRTRKDAILQAIYG
ncbi:MAG: HDOD domain-containing protein [Azoarcus sp.]|jgi:HD-like signal output (HDOD) protein|nr:HDOD domain-containing protein [Azoarcus sp.]